MTGQGDEMDEPPTAGRQIVTLREVAAHAGVSKSVVSRVLQGSPHVSSPKREQVQAAIRELGYRPNATARSLTQRRTFAVGVLVNDLRQPWFVDFLEGLNTTLHAHRLHAFIGDGRLDREADESLLRAFMEMRVDGLVLAGTMPVSDTIREAVSWLPTVVAGSRDFSGTSMDVVAEDDWAGAQVALDHLQELGHARIAHIAGGQGRVFELRRDSYLDWMARRELPARVEPCDTSEDGGYEAARRLLAGPAGQRPTALFAANDLASFGALAAAKELGLDVPRDLSVIGFDNSMLARLRQIQLSSVDIGAHRVGQTTAEFLVQRIDDPTMPSREQLEVPFLAARGTTASVPR